MQPTSGEMQGMGTPMPPCLNGSAPQIPIQELQNEHPAATAAPQPRDDFFDQVLSSLPWVDLHPAKSPWDLAAANGGGGDAAIGQKLFSVSLAGKPVLDDQSTGAEGLHYASPYDESALLASRLRQHQISGGGGPPGTGKPMFSGMGRSAAAGDSGLLPLPLSLGSSDSADSTLLVGDGLYNKFGGPLQRAAQAAAANQQHFHHPQNFGAPAAAMGQAPAAGAAPGGAAPPRQRVRARRGQATDPHSIAERLRRERIAERMKALQELVPNANKTDKASMLDEIIDYVKFLQLQVKVLSMSRLGGAAAVAPLVADMSSEASAGRSNVTSQTAVGGDGLSTTENQVAKLMEQDIGSAMQYLQGKGLCLMPISLASAISATAGHPRAAANTHSGNPPMPHAAADGPSSPSMSVLTVQSAVANGADTDVSRPSAKDAASVSKP